MSNSPMKEEIRTGRELMRRGIIGKWRNRGTIAADFKDFVESQGSNASSSRRLLDLPKANSVTMSRAVS